MNKTEIDDDIVEEVRKTRADLLAEHDGDTKSLLKRLRMVEAQSDKDVVQRLHPAPSQKKAS